MDLIERIKSKIKELEKEKKKVKKQNLWIEQEKKLLFVIDIKLEVLEEILYESEEPGW